MKPSALRSQAGLSLIELLVVLAVMGFVMAAVYGFYVSQTKTSIAQEDVAEVQQNLRIAMDMITKDIQKAGYLVSGANPLGAATATGITINTASASGTSALVTTQVGTIASTMFTVESADAADKFSVGDSARIIRPMDKSEPLNVICQVTAVNRATPSITLSINPAGATVNRGDVIVRTSAGAANPNTIAYSVVSGGSCPSGQNCLQRNATGTGNQLVATNIAPDADSDGADRGDGLRFSYILDDSSEVPVPPATTLTATQLAQVRAVRVTLTGVTDKGVLARDFGGAKQRVLTAVVSIRNR